MRTLLSVFILVVLAAGGRAEAYRLHDNSSLTLITPDGWNESHGNMVADTLFRFSPKNAKLNAVGELTISPGVVDEYDTKKKLSSYVADMARDMKDSLDPKLRQPDVKPFKCKQGFGFFFSIPDPSLAGKPSQPGNFKVITGGVIRLAPGVMVEVRMASDGDNTEGHQQLLAMIEGMELKR